VAQLGENRWGKSGIRVSKIHRGETKDDFSDLTVQVLLANDEVTTHTSGDNTTVLPTDTMKNTVYAMAQEHLTRDLEGFARLLGERFIARPDVDRVQVEIVEHRWERMTGTGFVGGGSEQRTARVALGAGETGVWAGVLGLIVLKTTGSAFAGFPHDEFTILPETSDRLLATSVTAEWHYEVVPADTTASWEAALGALMTGFFDEASLSLQHQGWLMSEAVLAAVPEITEITLHLPNQHHLPFDLTRFGMTDRGVVHQPVSEPYGDIALTVER
jgi:urate oxidase